MHFFVFFTLFKYIPLTKYIADNIMLWNLRKEEKIMGYLLVAISVLSGSVKGYCGKRTSDYVSEYKDAMLANTIRMGFCILIGFFTVLLQSGAAAFKIDTSVLIITLISGISTSVFVVSWLISVKKGAYMMLDVFCMMSVVIPLIGGYIKFGEVVKPTQWFGLAVLLAAVFIMCSYNNSIKTKMTLPSFLLLLVCGASGGFTDFSQKLFVKLAQDVPIAVFNFYTYIFSAVSLLICFIVFNNKSSEKASFNKSIKPIFGYVLIMSACLFINSYFKTAAANYLPAAKLYPLFQGSALTMSTIMSAVFFNERLNVKCIVGILISFIALIIINVL